MEHIDKLFLIANKNQVLLFFVSVFASFIESFVPALPLVLIVLTNAVFLGFTKGVIASTIGSGLGTFLVYYFSKKFRNNKIFKKFENDKLDEVTKFIKDKSSFILFFCYASFFMPSFLVSIASGISKVETKNFLTTMIVGKLCLFSIVSYVGNDLEGVLKSPTKILTVVFIFISMFIFSKKLTKK